MEESGSYPPVAVIGTGSWGTTLAILLARNGRDVRLWARTGDEATRLNTERENMEHLPGIAFPANLTVTAEPEQAIMNAGLVLLVPPAQKMRANTRIFSEAWKTLANEPALISCSKGLEIGSMQRMSEVISEELPGEVSYLRECVGALSGPNLAREVANQLPCTSVVACPNEEVARRVQAIMMCPQMRVYTNTDIIGVEIAGSLKNVIALGAGFCDGLEMGDNAKAALITRGLAEISRLGMAVGAKPLTFAGLAGLGDLIATCASPQSRNRYVGQEIARGRTLQDIQVTMKSVAEGVTTTIAACQLADRYNVEMPITSTTNQVLFHQKGPADAVRELMLRDPKGELG